MIAGIGHGLPLDLLHATGNYAGPLAWNAGRETPRASQWIESRFSPWARSILQDWADGAFDDMDTVVFGRADDAVQRLYYYICELQRRELIAGPRALIFDLAGIARTSSADHTIEKVRQLARELSVTDDALETAIVKTNASRDGQDQHGDGPACLLLGTPPPDRRLHDAIGAAGFVAAGKTLESLWRDAGPKVAEGSGDPAAAVGRQLHARGAGAGFEDNAATAVQRARECGARAAVQWYIEEDETRIWNAPAISKALGEAGIPTLVLTRRDWAARDGAAEEIRKFLAGVQP